MFKNVNQKYRFNDSRSLMTSNSYQNSYRRNYLYENKYSLFQNVQYWETMLNKIGDFCVNLALGQVLSSTSNISSNFSDLYGLMETINDLSLACKTQSPGIKDSGIKIEFNLMRYIIN